MNKTVEVDVKNISLNPESPIYAAYVSGRLIVGPSCDVRALAISLGCELARISHDRHCDFVVINRIEQGCEFKHVVSDLKFQPPNSFNLNVQCEKMPPPGSLSRKFYNWLSGKSCPKK